MSLKLANAHPEVRGVSSELVLAAHLNGIMNPRPHNSPPKPHVSLPTKRDEVLANKVIDKGTLSISPCHERVLSTDCDPLLILQNP